MNPADWPRDDRGSERLLICDVGRGALEHATIRDFARLCDPGDVVVVNDAATLPAVASFTSGGGEGELRVATLESPFTCRAVLFGAAPAPRAPTEAYAPAPRLAAGDAIVLSGTSTRATVMEVDARHPRLVRLAFHEPVVDALLRVGRPVQYAHVRAPLRLFHVQTSFATRPWAVEMPSAGRPLTIEAITSLRRRGVEVVALTHGAGLSSSGDEGLDARFPLRERYEIPRATADAVERARARGRGVIAVGTSVVRALESSADTHGGRVASGEAWTELLVGKARPPRVVTGILSGMHRPGTSHFELLEGFADADARTGLTLRSFEEAERRGYLEHEFGDSIFVTRRAPAVARRAA
ncbi:MAG: S-adenosylmethionine:tRNA ribosyltransferase-isomerase [Polyangiaceae bacterium]